jgi:hypothetical protein
MEHKTVLIVGAGITRASHKPSLRIPDLPPPLDRDFFRITSKLHSTDYREFVSNLKRVYWHDFDNLLSSLELTFSTIWEKAIEIPDWRGSQKNPHSDLAIKLVELIRRVLAQTSNEMDVSENSEIYRLFRGEIFFGDLTIITFNYDLLIECVLDRIASDFKVQYPHLSTVFCYPGCYRLTKMIGSFPGHQSHEFESDKPFVNESKDHKGVELLKLHGSLNWAHLVLEEDDMRQRVTGRGFGGVYVVNSKNILWNLPQWINKGNLETLAPAIIPPIPKKSQFLDMAAYDGVWKLAARRLNEATRITIAGYSFPPTDLEACNLLKDNSSNLIYINVINPDESVCERVKRVYGRKVSEQFYSISEYVHRFSRDF